MCKKTVRTIFMLIIGVTALTAQSDDVTFPPEPVRSIEEKKMKPMVPVRLTVSTSGSANKTADMMANRAGKVLVNPKGNDTNRSAIEKNKKQAQQKSKK